MLRACIKSGLTCHWLKVPPLLYCCAGSLQCVVRCKPTGPQIRLYGHCIHCIYHQSLLALQSTHTWSKHIYMSAHQPFAAEAVCDFAPFQKVAKICFHACSACKCKLSPQVPDERTHKPLSQTRAHNVHQMIICYNRCVLQAAACASYSSRPAMLASSYA